MPLYVAFSIRVLPNVAISDLRVLRVAIALAFSLSADCRVPTAAFSRLEAQSFFSGVCFAFSQQLGARS